MFELQNANAKISSFNPRAEKHGDDNKLAADIGIEVALGNEILEHFDSYLCGALFRAVRTGEQQELIEGARLTAVRFPRIGAVRWDEEYTGYELKIGNELGLSDPLHLVDVTVRKFSFAAIEGGSVAVKFSLICHPDRGEAGELCSLIQEQVSLTLIPPIKQDEQPGPDVPGAQASMLDAVAEDLSKAA